MGARISKRLLSLAFIAGAASPLMVPAATAEAATHSFEVVTQFQPPSAGQIEVIAVVFSARFSGRTAPLHPITNVTLPGASQPHNYGLLYGTRLTRVSGNVATYLWLTMALKPLGATGSHDQPLVGEVRSITAISPRSTSSPVKALELTINDADEPELAQFSATFRADGVLQFNVLKPKAVPTWNNFNWNRNPIPSSALTVWNSVGSLIENPQLSVPTVVQSIDATLHASFLSGSTSTGTGSSTSGSLRISCPTSVTQGQSIQIMITVGTPSAPVKITWTLPDGSTVVHTAIPNSTNPTTESDAIGTSQAGPWKVLASAQGQTATCPAITVNGP